MPMRLIGTERVGHHGLSLLPTFPRTRGTPRLWPYLSSFADTTRSVAEFRVVSHGGPGFTAHSRQSALWSKNPSLESARPTARDSMATSAVQWNQTFATNLIDMQGNLTLLDDVRKSPASIRNSGFEMHPHNASEVPGPECERKCS